MSDLAQTLALVFALVVVGFLCLWACVAWGVWRDYRKINRGK